MGEGGRRKGKDGREAYRSINLSIAIAIVNRTSLSKYVNMRKYVNTEGELRWSSSGQG